MSRRKKSGKKGNAVLMGLVAYLVVNDFPSLLSGLTGKPFSGITEDMVGMGSGYLVGHLTKDQTIKDASIIIGGGNILNGFIQPKIMELTSKVGTTTQKIIAPATSRGAALNDYTRLQLNDYASGPSAGEVTRYSSYVNSYYYN